MKALPARALAELGHGDVVLLLANDVPARPELGRLRALHYAIRRRDASAVVGTIDLRLGYTTHIVLYGGHVGYGVQPEHRGHGYAAQACRALLPVARGFGMDTVYITCNPDNWASRKTCERIGAVLIEIVDLPPDCDMYLEGERQKCRYRWTLY